MDKDSVALISVTVLGVATIVGVLWTKTPGWGMYSTSILILTLALFVIADLLVLGKLDGQQAANLFFSIVGFAGGLIAGKSKSFPVILAFAQAE
jgi:hypothetical protein